MQILTKFEKHVNTTQKKIQKFQSITISRTFSLK